MPLLLSEHPERDRPRERFWAVGPVALTAQELLAILLGTGCAGRDALVVAGDLLARVEGSLRRLMGRPGAELARVPGVGRAKAARLLASFELGRRVAAETEPAPRRIAGPHPRRAQSPERRPDALGRRSGSDAAAGGRGAPAQRPGV